MATKSKRPKRPSLIAARIDAKRVENGWKLTEFALRAGVSKGTAWLWCHGTSEPNVASLRRIGEVFGCEISELVDGTSAPISRAG